MTVKPLRGNLPGQMSNQHCALMFDEARLELTIKLFGFWDLAIAETLNRDIGKYISELGAAGVPRESLLVLIDVRESSIVANTLTDILKASIQRNGYLSKKVSILCGSILQKTQYKRLTPYDNFGHFTSESEAYAWLHDG